MLNPATAPVTAIIFGAWDRLRANPVLLLPGAVLGAYLTIVSVVAPYPRGLPTLAQPASVLAAYAPLLPRLVADFAFFSIVTVFALGMSRAAWERGQTNAGDGLNACTEYPLRLGTFVLYGMLGVAVSLIPLGFGTQIFLVLTLYSSAAIVIGGASVWGALHESYAIIRTRFGRTLAILAAEFAFLLILGVGLLLLVIGPLQAFHLWPTAGPLPLFPTEQDQARSRLVHLMPQAVNMLVVVLGSVFGLAFLNLLVVGEYLEATGLIVFAPPKRGRKRLVPRPRNRPHVNAAE